jgi:hypothetical protein
MNYKKLLQSGKDIIEGNSIKGLVLGIKEVIEDFKSGCTVLSGCGNVNITKFDIDWDDWEDDWDDEDTSCILVEEFHL